MIYSNSLNSNEEISNKLKEQLYKIYNDKKIMKYFKEIDKLEKNNIEYSQNVILKKDLTKSKIIDYDYLIQKLVYTQNTNIPILNSKNLEGYSLKCIIPINNDFFKGSLIIQTNEYKMSSEIKESFFRFCYGLFFIVQNYILYGNYEQYRLF